MTTFTLNDAIQGGLSRLGRRQRLVVSESRGFSPAALARLQTWADVTLHDCERDELLAVIPDADVLWVRLRHRIDREVFAAASGLACVVSPTTGLNHIDLALAAESGIAVLSLRGEVDFLKDIRATAELTLALMLALLRHLPSAAEHARAGGWNRDAFIGNELYGRTVGLVGYGRLGRIVARYLCGLDVRVLTHDPFISPAEVEGPLELVSLARLLEESDVVSLHVNLCDATTGMFEREQFSQMRRGAWFVNTSRGELVDEAALLEALETGHLAGAALDVLAHEDCGGMSQHPLVTYARTHENLILTPHLGGCTTESLTKTEEFLAERLSQWWCAIEHGRMS